jgi:hypothetical protein
MKLTVACFIRQVSGRTERDYVIVLVPHPNNGKVPSKKWVHISHWSWSYSIRHCVTVSAVKHNGMISEEPTARLAISQICFVTGWRICSPNCCAKCDACRTGDIWANDQFLTKNMGALLSNVDWWTWRLSVWQKHKGSELGFYPSYDG